MLTIIETITPLKTIPAVGVNDLLDTPLVANVPLPGDFTAPRKDDAVVAAASAAAEEHQPAAAAYGS